MSLIEQHFRNTEKLIRNIDKEKITAWLLEEGYFPEQYILPPSFKVANFPLQKDPYIKNLDTTPRRRLINISYPKTLLTYRMFGIQHLWNYHDLVFWLMSDWELVINHLFHKELKIFSYGFPIPVNARKKGDLSPLRAGRMIYEWIEMAEKDLVAEAHQYTYIIRSDISKFYNSIYTHSIAWALHGREIAFKDKENKLIGNKIDRIVQYANDARTNGIPVGSAISDLIAEIVLASIDRQVSKRLVDIDFIATRFKDDYRILCNTEEDAKKILKVLAKELDNFNLVINEIKTKILELPEGLYRQHDREYFDYSLRDEKEIDFKTFELTLLKALDIHRKHPGTSILEKFLSELFDNDHNFKVSFSVSKSAKGKQILKTFSLLMLLKRESEKVLCYVLSIIEAIYEKYRREFGLKNHLKLLIESETRKASKKESVFELVWLVFFARYLTVGVENFKELIDESLMENLFLKSMISSQQKIYNDSKIELFVKPKECVGTSLAKRLAVFNRDKN